MENLKRYTITLDDDPMICKIIAQATGINSLPFTSGASLLKRADSYDPVAVFVDINLGVKDCGLDMVPPLREIWQYCPIIVATGEKNSEFVGQALAAGANDFIQKPINFAELNGRLHARIAEMNRRKNSDEISLGDVLISRSKSFVRKNERTAYFAKLELQLLLVLLENRGLVLTKDELKRRLWGRILVSENALDKKLSCVRSLLQEVGSNICIRSIYGKGVALNLTDDAVKVA